MLTARRDVLLSRLTTFEVGGVARDYVEATNEGDVREALSLSRGRELLVLGGGSNLLVSDEPFEGVVLAMRTRGVDVSLDGDEATVTAQAGEPWDDLVATAAAEGLSGIECLSGIPGRVGAVPIQNVGAYGQEVGDVITAVRALDRASGEVVTLSPAACAFGYRDSAFKSRHPGRYVVLSVTMRLRRGAPQQPRYAELARALGERGAATAAEVRDVVLSLRRAKSMVLSADDENRRSAGSFFTNPIIARDELPALVSRLRARGALGEAEEPPLFDGGPGRVKVPAAWLIERAGFKKGHRDGAVGLSSRHALAVVAHDGARARDVWALATRIRQAVEALSGLTLEPEPVLVGSFA